MGPHDGRPQAEDTGGVLVMSPSYPCRRNGEASQTRELSSSGEPDAWKLASPVRRGADGKGRMTYLASGLPDNMHPLAYGKQIPFPAQVTYQRAGPVRVLARSEQPYQVQRSQHVVGARTRATRRA